MYPEVKGVSEIRPTLQSLAITFVMINVNKKKQDFISEGEVQDLTYAPGQPLTSILVNNQLEAQFFFRIYLFQFSTCFENP